MYITKMPLSAHAHTNTHIIPPKGFSLSLLSGFGVVWVKLACATDADAAATEMLSEFSMCVCVLALLGGVGCLCVLSECVYKSLENLHHFLSNIDSTHRNGKYLRGEKCAGRVWGGCVNIYG